MTFEYGGKADEGILAFGLICAVGALILKYFRIRERGTVLSPKKTDEEKKAHLASGLKKENAPPDSVAREKDISAEIEAKKE